MALAISALLLSLPMICSAWGSDAVPIDPDVLVTQSPANSGEAPPRGYPIGAGDTLTIQVYGEDTLSGSFPVDESGNLDFPLLGAVAVAGLPATEVSALLEKRLSPGYLVHPSVTVWISAWRSQPVQVLGAVARPGTYFLRGPTTVLQLISEVGGVSGPGVNEVRITRGADEQVLVLPYDQLLTGATEELALAAGDIVFVPQSLVSVLGSVGKPGEIAWRDGITLSQGIASVGGLLPTADRGRISILRGDTQLRVNLRRILSGRATDVQLRPGDRIIVRESAV